MKKILIISILGAFIALSAKEIILTPKQINDMGIVTAPLSSTQVLSQSNLPATIVIPPRQLSIASSINNGIVQKVFVGIGDSVKAGQTVAMVSFTEALTIQSEYIQTASRLNRLESIAKKDEALFKDGIISEREYLKSKLEANLVATELAEKKGVMKMMGVSISGAGILNTTSTIKAPISGIVLEQLAVIGQKVDAMSPIYKIADLSTLWIEIQTPSSISKSIAIGDLIQTNLGVTAKVIKISSGVELQNQSVIVRALITSGKELVRPGQFIQASIQTPTTKSIVVPKNGLVRNKGENVVFTKTTRGFSPIPVKILKEECSSFIIAGPLKGDERVVIQGTIALKGIWIGEQDSLK